MALRPLVWVNVAWGDGDFQNPLAPWLTAKQCEPSLGTGFGAVKST